jgi:hypothetical protein
MRPTKIGLALGWLLIGMIEPAVFGDGGTIRLSQREGAYRITVFTAPTPFRAGPVDISVLLQDATTGEPSSDARVTLWLTSIDHPSQRIRHSATSEEATNKLLRAAVFTLPEPGRWTVDVDITGASESARVRFELEASGRLPRWPAIWPWIAWPLPVIVLFAIHQILVGRKRHRPA